MRHGRVHRKTVRFLSQDAPDMNTVNRYKVSHYGTKKAIASKCSDSKHIKSGKNFLVLALAIAEVALLIALCPPLAIPLKSFSN